MWQIERLSAKHERLTFDCGKPALNEWLTQRASQWDKKDLARTYVLIPQGKEVVAGYYCLSNHHVRFDALPADQARGFQRLTCPSCLSVDWL